MSAANRSQPAGQCRCGRCGAVYPRAAFTDLVPVRTVTGAELAANVVSWPDGMIVEVRACARCQAPIARLARAS